MEERKSDEFIPKIIHYCWFGKKDIPNKQKKYINTWKKKCPEYKQIEWNEENFPINEFIYAKEAYEVKKMAFVSDVARIYALYRYGGIYLDTDVELIKNFNPIITKGKVILGWEKNLNEKGKMTIGTGFMAFTPKHKICKELLEYYSKKHFISKDGTLNTKPNTYRMAEIVKQQYNISPKEEIQNVNELIIFPKKYFTAFNAKLGKSEISNETYCVHHFASSWHSIGERGKRKLKTFINRTIK